MYTYNITSERAARRRMRLERDFDPGNLTVPEMSLMGCSTISGAVDGFSAVATEAITLTDLTEKLESLLETRKQFDELLTFFEPKNIDCEGRLKGLGFRALGRGNFVVWNLYAKLLTCAIS